MKPSRTHRRNLLTFCLFAASLIISTALSGCIVAGASSTGGWFIWPGGLGLVVVVLLAIFLLRGRR